MATTFLKETYKDSAQTSLGPKVMPFLHITAPCLVKYEFYSSVYFRWLRDSLPPKMSLNVPETYSNHETENERKPQGASSVPLNGKLRVINILRYRQILPKLDLKLDNTYISTQW